MCVRSMVPFEVLLLGKLNTNQRFVPRLDQPHNQISTVKQPRPPCGILCACPSNRLATDCTQYPLATFQ